MTCNALKIVSGPEVLSTGLKAHALPAAGTDWIPGTTSKAGCSPGGTRKAPWMALWTPEHLQVACTISGPSGPGPGSQAEHRIYSSSLARWRVWGDRWEDGWQWLLSTAWTKLPQISCSFHICHWSSLWPVRIFKENTVKIKLWTSLVRAHYWKRGRVAGNSGSHSNLWVTTAGLC